MAREQDNPRLREILDHAAVLPPAQREPYLDEACGGDTEFRAEIESLLAALEGSDGFFDDVTISQEHLGVSSRTESSPQDERIGERIGRYKLLQRIGEGGFGTVYMAEQERPVRRTVALKVIKPGMDSAAVIARFEAERQALAMMEHPNIARVLDAGTTQSGRPYFVMELVQGIPINQYCDRKRLTPRQRIELLLPVCRAVQHAHQKGIIHRDLKPTNILVMTVDGQPVPKVIDFGVAKALHQRLTEKTLFTQFGNAIGTPEYMSPEQADMDVVAADTRSDIYSLGVLLYELLTGFTPLDRRNLREAGYAQMLRMIREVEPLRPSTRLTQSGDNLASLSSDRSTNPKELTHLIAGDLDWIVMKCLEKDRGRRYETANGLARDLERFLDDEPVEASPPSAADRFRRYVRKHRLVFVVTSMCALTLLVATAVSSWQAVRATLAKAAVVVEKSRADQEAAAAKAAQQTAEMNLSQAVVAEADALGAGGQWREAKDAYRRGINLLRSNGQSTFVAELGLWMANCASPSPLLEWRAHNGEVTHLRFFPDGHRLASIGQDGTGKIWDAQTRRLIRTISDLGDVQRLSIAPDGTLIAFASTSTGFTVWNTGDGTQVRALSGLAGRASAVAFSPDGRYLLVGTADPPYALGLFDVATGSVLRKFAGHMAAVRDVAFSPDGTRAFSCDGRGPGDYIGSGFKTSVRGWDIARGAMVWSNPADSEDRLIGHLAVSPNGETVTCTAWDGGSKVIDTVTGATRDILISPGSFKHDVQGVAHSVQDVVATAGASGSIKMANPRGVYSLAHAAPHATLAGHLGEARALDFSPDGEVLASAGDDGFVRVWPVYAGAEVRVFPDYPGWLANESFCVDISHDGRYALTSNNQDNLVRLWDVSAGAEIRRLPTPYGVNTSAAFGPEGKTIVLIEDDAAVGIWDGLLQTRLGKLDPPDGREFETVALSPDGRTLLTGFADGNDLAAYDLPAKRLLRRLTLDPAPTGTPVAAAPPWPDCDRRLRFSPDGTFAAGMVDRTNLLRVWDTSDWHERFSVPVPNPRRMAISPDSRLVACDGWDTRIFDARSGRLVNQINDHPNAHGTVVFLPDPRYVLTLGQGLWVWDLTKNQRVRFLGPASFVWEMSVSDDRKLLWYRRSVGGTLNVAPLDWIAQYDARFALLEPACRRLQDIPADVQALIELAKWYAFRGMSQWSIDLLDRAGRPASEKALLELCHTRLKVEHIGPPPIARDQVSSRNPLPFGLKSGGKTVSFATEVLQLTRSLSRHPSDTASIGQRGLIQARIGQFKIAEEDFSRLVDLQPDDSKNWLRLMALLAETGNVTQYSDRRKAALARFESVLSPAASDIAMGSLLMPAGDDELAQTARLVDRALSGNAADSQVSCLKGVLEYRMGRFEEALKWLSKGADDQTAERMATTEFYRSMALARSGHESDARSSLSRGALIAEIQLGKRCADDLTEGKFPEWIFCDLARKEAVLEVMTQELNRNPSDPTLLTNRGTQNALLNRSDQAVADFRMAINATSEQLAKGTNSPAERSSMLRSRAGCYARLWSFSEALSDFQQAVTLSPEDYLNWHEGLVPLLMQVRNIEVYRQRRSQELRRFRDTTDKGIARAVARDALMLPLDGEDLTLALKLADRSWTADEYDWAAFQAMGMAEYRSGHYEAAIPLLLKCRDLHGVAECIAAAEFAIALCFEKLQDHAHARAAMDRGLKAFSELPQVGKGVLANTAPADWIFVEVLRHEAEGLVNHIVPDTRPANTTP
jgi:serine/threonine protein kinase/WD40 repeat protein/tetratricopeptide (TPR) repeat protein